MKPAAFEYHRPESVDAAVRLLDELGDEAKVIAGGQSLVPLMNLRLATPAHLVDLRDVDGLRSVSLTGGELVVGAMVTYAEIEDDPRIEPAVPLLADAVPRIAHRSIRHRGTVGGSLAHADPAAELPAAALALGARIGVASVAGNRDVAASDLFVGPFMTCLEDNELIVSVTWPSAAPAQRSGMFDVVRRPGDYALAGVACSAALDAGRIRDARLVAYATGPTPYRLAEAEAVVEGARITDDVEAEAVSAAGRDTERVRFDGDGFAYEQHVTAVLVRRALRWLAAGGPR